MNRKAYSLLIGSALAGFGGWIDFLAILTLASYEYQVNAYSMALLSATFLLPSIIGGKAVGRFLSTANVNGVLVVALLLRTAATGALLLHPSIAIFIALVLVRSCFTVPVEPGGNMLVKQHVEAGEVKRYFAVFGVLRNLSKVSAPAIGAAIASLYGESHAIELSIGLSLAAVATLAAGLGFSGAAPAPSAAAGQAPSTAKHKDALNKELTAVLVTMTIFAFMVFMVNNQLPVLLRNGGFDKALLGLLVSSSGAGGILMSAYVARRNRKAEDPMRQLWVAVMCIAACFSALGVIFFLPLSMSSTASCVLFFLTGCLSARVAINSSTAVVARAGEEVGMWSARLQAYQSTAMLVAPWAGAALIGALPMQWIFILDGAGAACLLVLASAVLRARTASASNDAPVVAGVAK